MGAVERVKQMQILERTIEMPSFAFQKLTEAHKLWKHPEDEVKFVFVNLAERPEFFADLKEDTEWKAAFDEEWQARIPQNHFLMTAATRGYQVLEAATTGQLRVLKRILTERKFPKSKIHQIFGIISWNLYGFCILDEVNFGVNPYEPLFCLLEAGFVARRSGGIWYLGHYTLSGGI